MAFAFFTSLCYAVLARRFDRQRAAVVMAVALGLALSVGLVWWEVDHGFSIRDMGPLAVGFVILILAGVMYQAFRQVGGSWAGAGLALGASILIGWALGIDWPVDAQIIQTITIVALTAGAFAFLLHRRTEFSHRIPARAEVGAVRHDLRDIHHDRCVANRIGHGLDNLRHEADVLVEQPDRAGDVMLQLQRMLPEEGWLTNRLATLRAKAHRMRAGHVARLKELRDLVGDLPPEDKRKISRELADRYEELKLDVRLERLDRAVAENERRVRELTRQAQAWLEAYDYRHLSTVLDEAAKLQHHNAKLLKAIERTEARLLAAAKDAARQARNYRS